MPNLPSPMTEPTLRDDLPRYPPLVQLLRTTATTVAGPSGVAQVAASSALGPTLYVAFVQQLRTDALLPRDREPCLVDDVNGFGIEPGYYLGRLAGSHTGLPVYEVTEAASGGADTFLEVRATTPSANFYDVRIWIRDQVSGFIINTGRSAWLYTPNQSTFVVGQFYQGMRTAALVAGRPVFATEGSLFAFVKCNSDTQGLGGYDARYMRFAADGTLTEVAVDDGGAVWLLSANSDTKPIKDRIYFCALSGFNFGRHVYQTEGTVLVRLVRCDSATPTSGRYSGTLMTENDDGSITASATDVWLRDGNNTPALISGEVYLCKRTGYTANKPVYTTVDFNLTVRDQDLSQSQDRTLYEEFGPANNWLITRPAARRTLVKRVLDIYEGGTLKSDFTKKLTFDSTDFDVTGGTNESSVNTSGYSGSFDVVVNCTAGVLRVKCLTFTNGLLKSVGAERDLGSGTCP